jgi:outer membrane cobalamin receptor
MRLEDVDSLAKMAATYKRLATMEADLRRDWNCSRISVKIEWQATGKTDDHTESEMHNVLRAGFATAVKAAREQVQSKLALLGVEHFPEVK